MAYLSIVALIPFAAVVFKSLDGGVDSFWNAVSSPQAVAVINTLYQQFCSDELQPRTVMTRQAKRSQS